MTRPNGFLEKSEEDPKNLMAIGTATCIIKKGVNNNIFNNIIDMIDFQEI